MAAILGLGTGGTGGQTRVGVTGPRVSWGGCPLVGPNEHLDATHTLLTLQPPLGQIQPI